MEGLLQPGFSVLLFGASFALAADIEPEEREAAKEASVLATFVAEKLELWGKLPKANLGLFFTSYWGEIGGADAALEDSSTTQVSTFSTGGGVVVKVARLAGSVAALPDLIEEREIELGTTGVVAVMGVVFAGLVGPCGPITPSFSSAGLNSSTCLGSILTSYLLLSTARNFGLGSAGKEMLLFIELRMFFVRVL